MALSAAWVFAGRWVDKTLGLVTTLVLARLLVPGDFGLVAMATVVVALLELMAAFGFDSALIQHRNPTRDYYDTVWSIEILFAGAIALCLSALAFPMAHIYDEPRLAPVMFTFALVSLIGSLRNVGCVDFRRYMKFHKEFQIGLYRRLLSIPITLGLAFWLRSYWALVLGVVFSTSIGTVLTYIMHPFRPRWSLARSADLFSFSRWLFANNLLAFLCQRSGDFLVGKLRGPHDLGVFAMANEFGSLPATEVVAPINRAAFPGYSRLSSDLRELINTFLRVIGLIAIVVLPVGVGISLTAPLFVPLLLGQKWEEAIPLMQLVALAAAQLGLWTNTMYVLIALGRPKLALLTTSIQATATICFLLAFLLAEVPHGPGWALLAAATTTGVPSVLLWNRALGVTFNIIVGILWRPVVGVVTMSAMVLFALSQLGPVTDGPARLLSLTIAIAVGAATYAATVLAAWWLSGCPLSAEWLLLDRAKRVLKLTGARRSEPG